MYEAATVEYKKAIAIEPNNARLYYNLGVAYSRLEKHKEAAEQFAAVLSGSTPNLPMPTPPLPSVCYMLKKYDAAWEHAKTAKKLGFEVPKDLYEELYRKINK